MQTGIGSYGRDAVVSLPPLVAVPEEPTEMPGQLQPSQQQQQGKRNSVPARQIQPDAAAGMMNVQVALEGGAPLNAPLSTQQTVTVSPILLLARGLFIGTCLHNQAFPDLHCTTFTAWGVFLCAGRTEGMSFAHHCKGLCEHLNLKALSSCCI
jgi:hypothetical protein